MKIIEKIKKINFDGILIDTENKKNGNLRNYLNDNYLKTFINFAKRKKLSIGLAGSLGINDINPLLQLSPDYIGFRGALCSGFKNRTNICKNSINNVISEFRCRSI